MSQGEGAMERNARPLVGLQGLIRDLRTASSALTPDNAFVLWFVTAGVFNPHERSRAAETICGSPGDRGFDAIVSVDARRTIYLIQGKYRRHAGKSEGAGGIRVLVDDATSALNPDRDSAQAFWRTGNPLAQRLLRMAWRKIHEESYQLVAVYLTTGRIGKAVAEKATADFRHRMRRYRIQGRLDIEDSARLAKLLKLYLEGAAPPTPTIRLDIEGGTTPLRRTDARTGITSWIFPTTARSIARAYQLAESRLFDKNIRGFLGNTKINRAMVKTLREHDQEFFYLNNGITIVAESVTPLRDSVDIDLPQVINGQQTIRTLAEHAENKTNVSVLVKVIELAVQRERSRDDFVAKVVEGTNWQNSISLADLRANDHIQIQLERALYNLRYLYLRKRQSTQEARRLVGMTFYTVKKEYLAKAVGATELDPWDVRSGTPHLFEHHYRAIFRSDDPYFYLARYWFLKCVDKISRGRAEDRAYSKWLVMWFAWRLLHRTLRSRAARRAFAELCEAEVIPPRPLAYIVERIFIAARAYMSANKWMRGLDASRFYRDRKDHHRKFAQFWRTYPQRKKRHIPQHVRAFSQLTRA
jgi:hypothetical protein